MGSLVLPATATAADTIYSGNSTLLRADNNYNFFAGVGAGSLTTSGDFNTASGCQRPLRRTRTAASTPPTTPMPTENTRGAGIQPVARMWLYSNTSGSYNTAFGEEALLSNVSGFGNTALGFQAGILITGNGNIDIGNSGYCDGQRHHPHRHAGKPNQYLYRGHALWRWRGTHEPPGDRFGRQCGQSKLLRRPFGGQSDHERL